MSYTFGFTHQVDYPSLGICGVCGVRYTHGCEHSNTLEAQEWLAAYIIAEQMQSYNPDVEAIETHIESADILDWFAEKTAEHADWLDEHRTTREAAQ